MELDEIGLENLFYKLDEVNKGYVTFEDFANAIEESSVDDSGFSPTATAQTIEALKLKLNPQNNKIDFLQFQKCFNEVMSSKSSSLTPDSMDTQFEPLLALPNTVFPSTLPSYRTEDLYEDGPFGDDTDDDFDFSECTSSGVYSLESPTHARPPKLTNRPQQLMIQSIRSTINRRKSTGGLSLTQSAQGHAKNTLHRRSSCVMLSEEEVSPTPEVDLQSRALVTADTLDQEMTVLLGRQEDLSEEVEKLRGCLRQSEMMWANERDKSSKLVSRIHALEEQSRDMEIRCEELSTLKDRQYKTTMEQHDREKSEESQSYKESMSRENILQRLVQLESESSGASSELSRLKSDYDRLLSEKHLTERQLQKADVRYEHLEKTLENYRQVTVGEIDQLQRERDRATELMTRLYTQLEDLTRAKRRVSSPRYRSSGVATSPSVASMRSRHSSGSSGGGGLVAELEELVKRLTAENKALQESLTEAQAELMTWRVEPSRDTLIKRDKGASFSLAHELNQPEIDELNSKLAYERETVRRLRSYLETILLRVINDPGVANRVLQIKQN